MAELQVHAPKDAVDRKSVYIMVDTLIEGTKRIDGTSSQEIYLDSGRLEGKLEIIGGIKDRALCEKICNVKDPEGFHKLVKGIGVSVSVSDGNTNEDVVVAWKHYGKDDRYNRGTRIEMHCARDGRETLCMFDDVVWDETDDVIGNLTFFLDYPGQIAEVNVRLIVDDSLNVPEGGKDEKVDRTSKAYKEMISRSLVSAGNDGRLERVIKRAKQGEKLTFACIGGSITQGAGAKPINSRCYAYQTYLGFVERFCKNEEQCTYVKAGVGGTPSEYGLQRYNKEVLLYGERKADVVIIEFAVNDYDDETEGRCFESLVREVLKAPNAPAVIILFSVFANDGNLQERIIPIGNYYGVPMVSVKNAVVPQFGLSKEEGRVISKRQYFYDTFHPTNTGHEVMTDCILYMLDTVNKRMESTNCACKDGKALNEAFTALKKGSCMKPVFDDLVLVERKDISGYEHSLGGFTDVDAELQCVERDFDTLLTPEFADNFKHVSGKTDSFKLTLNAKAVFLTFKDSGDVRFGSANVFVNGKLAIVANPRKNGWTHCNTRLIFEAEKETTVEIEIKMCEGDEDKFFTILAFGYTK